MPLIKKVNGILPVWGNNCVIAENATITGDVVMGSNCSVWFNAVIRGDVHSIRIGDNVNIQDNVVIHCTYQKSPVSIGNNVSIAHGAIVHGCTIGNNVLVGMGAIIMDDVVVEDNVIIAAGAVVTKGVVVESGSVYGGMPAKKIKSLDISLLEGEVKRISGNYMMYAGWYDEGL
ncbi:MAG: gamma carbonic anhydrase family protein [Bacteroidetes bacterium HGW-Bacteroidetes-6]|jgi:carbonic anhydrase/acetyltransferase-like protein (isoleucine patch superfamily)|nr:MAG: gamma carbonic anhydrase family protein [Bacteroidetes bacterium HGW-Bacteroidetes-6]